MCGGERRISSRKTSSPGKRSSAPRGGVSPTIPGVYRRLADILSESWLEIGPRVLQAAADRSESARAGRSPARSWGTGSSLAHPALRVLRRDADDRARTNSGRGNSRSCRSRCRSQRRRSRRQHAWRVRRVPDACKATIDQRGQQAIWALPGKHSATRLCACIPSANLRWGSW